MVKRNIRHRRPLAKSSERHRERITLILVSVAIGLLAVAVWSYWPTILLLMSDWKGNDDYSAGQLVPLAALVLLWVERKKLTECELKPFWLGGIALLLLAQAARAFGLLFMYESAERYSLVLTIAGLVLTVAGWRVFRRVLWILLFLFLMVPFPGRVHNMISGPLQNLASTGSAFVLEALMGVVGVERQGNVLTLGDTTMGVAEACSGLRMLTAFIIVAAFVAYMVKRPRWQKAVVLFSSVPIAIICNIVRIVVTAVLMMLVNAETAEKFFHDFAGLVMMPVAVVLMFGELWLMDQLIVSESEPQQVHRRTRQKTSTSPAKQMNKRAGQSA